MILQTRVIFSLSPGYYLTFNKITAFTRDLCFATRFTTRISRLCSC